MRADAMTTHYIDLTLLPDPESSPTQLLGALYGRLHLAFVQQRQDSIGVSFPGYSVSPRTLGKVLRLHGHVAHLQQLMGTDWEKSIRDHVRATGILPAPANAEQRLFQRRQFKTSADRLRRRRMRRKGETAEQAAAAIPVTMERRPDLPYVHMRSHSTRQPSFCLFVAMGPPLEHASEGAFNCYGLSQTATVPWF